MSAVIGVDGGGTKTRIAVKTESKEILVVNAGGTNYESIGLHAVRQILRSGIEEVLTRSGNRWDDISAACFGMAGIDFDIDKKNFTLEVLDKLPMQCPCCVVNDAYIALKAGTDSGRGIVLNAGTGIKLFGTSDGNDAYSDAVGISPLQHRIIHALGREIELNDPDKQFSLEICRRLDVEDPFTYLQWLFLYNKDRKSACPYSEKTLHDFPRVFFDVLRRGSLKAEGILESMVHDFTELFSATASRLNTSLAEFELILSGSIFTENTDIDFEGMFFRRFSQKGLSPTKISILEGQPYEGALSTAEKIRSGKG